MRVFAPPQVALVTCGPVPQLDPDSHHLADRLSACGVEAVPAAWDDPALDWDRFGLTVIRCGASLRQRHTEFAAWASGVRRLANPVDVLGLDDEPDPATQVRARRWIALVFLAGRFSHALRAIQGTGSPDLAEPHRCGPDSSAPMEPTLATAGELTVARQALDRSPGGLDRLLYARVDVAASVVGPPTHLRLDLVAPALHLAAVDGAADRLAAAIKHRIPPDAPSGWHLSGRLAP